jgi:hypothetical protein
MEKQHTITHLEVGIIGKVLFKTLLGHLADPVRASMILLRSVSQLQTLSQLFW